MLLIRAETAEADVAKLTWQKQKLENRWQKLEGKLERRGRWTTPLFQQAKALEHHEREGGE